MDVLHGRGPLQGVRAPWILGGLGAAPHGVEEVEDEDQLSNPSQDSEHGDDDIDVLQLVEDGELRIAVVASWKSCQTGKVHGEEYPVGRDECEPEVQVAQALVHHAAVHFGEPMVNPGEHSEDRRKTHYNVEVGHNEVGIVHVDVQCGVTQDDTRQTTGHKGAHQADGEQHGGSELDISFPEGGDVVEGLYRRWDGNQQGREGEDRAQEGVHARDEHVVSPNDKG